MSVAVFDIDGVVADVRHRLHHIESRPKNWHEFFSCAADDPALAPGLALVADLATEHEIIWLTGRPSWLRSLTTDWLRAQDLPSDELHMRPRADYRPAAAFKLDVLNTLRDRVVTIFVDDDSEVVDAANAAGYPAVFADWLPRTRSLREAQDRIGRT